MKIVFKYKNGDIEEYNAESFHWGYNYDWYDKEDVEDLKIVDYKIKINNDGEITGPVRLLSQIIITE
jgi:hypothetical protein